MGGRGEGALFGAGVGMGGGGGGVQWHDPRKLDFCLFCKLTFFIFFPHFFNFFFLLLQIVTTGVDGLKPESDIYIYGLFYFFGKVWFGLGWAFTRRHGLLDMCVVALERMLRVLQLPRE